MSARTTDPDTSHLASRASSASAKLTDRARVLVLLDQAHGDGLTDFELAHALGKQQTSIGKRRGELVTAGRVEWAGTYRPAPSGCKARVWRIIR